MRDSELRALVIDTYARIREQGFLADRALQRAIRDNRGLHSRQRRQLAESVYGMLRLERRYDHLFSQHLPAHHAFETLATPERFRLRYAAALVVELEMDFKQAAFAAGFESWLAPVLEKVTSGQGEWPDEPLAALAIRQSIPDWAASRFLASYGEDAELLVDALNKRAPLCLRANLLVNSREEVISELAKEGVEAKAGKLSSWAVLVQGRPNVFALRSFKEGRFEVQDEGSQLIALACEAKAGERVVDACAGAGGKSLALAASMENRGRIFAWDVSEDRLSGLPPRARRGRAFNLETRVVPKDGPEPGNKGPWRQWRERIDLVLVDAPCTGSGSWRRNPDARWRMSEEEAEGFPKLQLSILERSARLLKSSGRLVYATCSVFSEENDSVVDAFLERNPGFERYFLPVPENCRDEKGQLRVFPHIHGSDGFFAAGFRRKDVEKR